MLSKRSPLPPLSIVMLIVGITIVPLAILMWLGWRLLEQDRMIEGQRVQERLERAADLTAAALQRAISVSEQRMAAGGGQWAEGAVILTFREVRVDAYPPQRVAYLPVVPMLPQAPEVAFSRAEEIEFLQHDRAGAIQLYAELAKSANPALRAGALLRFARNLKSVGRIDEALEAYNKLSALDGVSVGPGPAGLVARYARCQLFEESHRAAELRLEAERLASELHHARWPLTAPTYWLYSQDAAKWTGEPSNRLLPAEIFANATAALWKNWNRMPSSGRDTLRVNGQTLSVIWQTSGGSFRALLAAPEFVESQWLSAAAGVARQQGIRLAILGDAGAGTAPKTVRRAADTGLPWNIIASPVSPAAPDREFALRRRLLIAGFVLLVSMALTASYMIFRAVSRELAVVRLQSDFVAAVSHEFRTPLTALRQFTDMLRDHASLSDERRRVCYEAQSRATDRLTRLVESLLDFGRMQAGARLYRFERRDCTQVVERVVEEFRSDAQAAEYDIEFHGNGSVEMDLDSEALSRAIWNLLENAVKYSPHHHGVQIGLQRRDGSIRIAVRDRGIGIPPHEQAAIFTRFRRGEEARKLGIKGTGIGLAMVDQIVKAHRGRVEVESEPGQGSTFTIVLPLRES